MEDVKKIIRKNMNLMVLCITSFSLGFPLGLTLYEEVRGDFMDVIEELKDRIIRESKTETALNIFINNYRVSLILLLLGTFIIPNPLILFSNGFIAGLVYKYTLEKGHNTLFFFKAVLPHAIFELPAIFIASALGMRIGLSFLSTNPKKIVKNTSQTIKEAIIVHIIIVTPLLLTAALIETYISSNLI